MSEAETQHAVVEFLRAAGWVVKVFSQSKRTQQQLTGWVDVFAVRNDHVLLIESKSATGRRSDDQLRFALSLLGHIGPHVKYVVARSLDDVLKILESPVTWAGVAT